MPNEILVVTSEKNLYLYWFTSLKEKQYAEILQKISNMQSSKETIYILLFEKTSIQDFHNKVITHLSFSTDINFTTIIAIHLNKAKIAKNNPALVQLLLILFGYDKCLHADTELCSLAKNLKDIWETT